MPLSESYEPVALPGESVQADGTAPRYEYMKNALEILQWLRGPNRWVLKCPQHLEQLPVLRKRFYFQRVPARIEN